MNNLNLNKAKKGFSLVELLVGMAISLFVAGVAISYLVTSSRNLTEKTGLDLVQENTRFALEMLSSNIRLAGLINVKNTGSDELDPLFTQSICHSDFKTQPTGSDTSACNLDNVNNAFGGISTMQSDRLAIQMETNRPFQTCAGTTITPGANLMARVVTVFWAGDIDGDGVSSLYCQTYTDQGVTGSLSLNYTLEGNAIPLVDGIEMFQVQYGIDTDATPDGDIDTYQPFSGLSAGQIANILSVKIGLLVSPGQTISSEQSSDNANEEKEYQVLDGYYKSAATDRVRRQAITTTIFLPNMAS